MVDFFVLRKNLPTERRIIFMVKIIKQELEFEECLKQRLEFICEFSKVTPTFVNGSIREN